MLASYQWLQELTGIDASPETYAETLTDLGLEVEALHRFTAPPGVVVAIVKRKRPHPDRDKLQLVTIDDGAGEHEIVCGAPNVPDAGAGVLFARLGAVLPTADGGTFEIAERAIGGIPSAGMLCSETELGIGSGTDGIFVFASDPPAAGTRLADALPVEDVVFEIGVTPNRPDALGHIGIARDLAARLGVAFQLPAVAPPTRLAAGPASLVGDGATELWSAPSSSADGSFDLAIEDAERCPRYGAAFVRGVTVGKSPFWLRHRLHVLGLRSISNLVDATNLVLLETGHPIHGFDHDRLRGAKIVVRCAKAGETMETLDGQTRQLDADDLLICDGEGPVAIAGVMGGADSEIGDDTKNVVIECAYFDPRSVRRTSRRLDLHTDASHRFERGVDFDDVPHVMARAASLMAELGGGTAVAQARDLAPNLPKRAEITLRIDAIERLLGVRVEAADARKALEALGVLVSGDDTALQCVAPSWRPDLGREADLIEEVGRVRGYDLVPTVVPAVRPASSRTESGPRVSFERQLREATASSGLLEAVTYSFVDADDLAKAKVPTAVVEISNPMSTHRSVMRTSLLPGLAQAADHSFRRQVDEVGLFELGRVFRPRTSDAVAAGAWGECTHSEPAEDQSLPLEHPVLGLLLGGLRSGWIGGARDVDFYDLKAHVEFLVRASTGETPTFEVVSDPPAWSHPSRVAEVRVGDTVLGFAGEIHPEVADAFGLEVRVTYAELDVVKLLQSVAHQKKAVSPPKYPAVTRDVALQVAQTVQAGSVAAALEEASGGLAESVELFDLYEGDGLPDGQKSLAFRIRYRDPAETLTDKRVDKAHSAAVAAAQKSFDAVIR